MQGCPARCAYCHNPDTWDIHGGSEMSSDEILALYEKNKAFYSKGGITVSGGEPLLQIDFLLGLFEGAKAKGIHTCIDTSGMTFNPKNQEYTEKLRKLMSLTDIVMLDIKHMDSEAHKKLTGIGNEGVLAFARWLSELGVSIWVRRVAVVGYTDDEDENHRLGEFLATLKTVKALDVLPYHTMGVNKYKELGIPYPLEGMNAATHGDAQRSKQAILAGFRAAKEK
jgi:pyruvate formate lyase activating enzyme